MVRFLGGQLGRYPFATTGGVVAGADLGFALETQTRPVYDRRFWAAGRNVYVVVHENAHQWFGDSVSVRNWRDIWLNEGFATFAEWLWSEKHREGTGQQLLQAYYDDIPASRAFWTVRIGDPGRGHEFDDAVYDRGAMTLQALRNRIGERAFTTTLRTWVQSRRYGHGSVADFMALAERTSGQQLDGFFSAWLFTGRKPAATPQNGLVGVSGDAALSAAPSRGVRATQRRLDRTHALLQARR